MLSMPPEDARAAVGAPERAGSMGGAADRVRGRAAAAEQPSGEAAASAVPAELDDTGIPWVPRLGGRAPLGAELEHVARTGRWDRSHYAGRSEARMAVVGSAAARGWQLADVRAAVASGAWKGLAALYERRSEPGRMERLLPLEWRKTIGGISREENVRSWHTSDLSTRPPAQESSSSSAEYGLDPPVAHGDPLRARGPGAGQGLGSPGYRGAPGAARARPGRDGQRLEHDRVRHAEPGPALGPESPDGRAGAPACSRTNLTR